MDKKKTAPPPATGKGQQNTPNAMIPIDDISGGSFLLNFTGQNEQNLFASLKLICKKAETAQILAMQFQGFVTMGATMMAQQAPQQQDGESPAMLALDISKAIKFIPEGNILGITIELTPQLIERMKKVSEGIKNQPTPAPGVTPASKPAVRRGKI